MFNNDFKNETTAIFCGSSSSLKLFHSYFMSVMYFSCFIDENSSFYFQNCTFSGSKTEEIQSRSKTVVFENCEFVDG